MKKSILKVAMGISLVVSSLMATEVNSDAVNSLNAKGGDIKGYYVNFTGAEWIYVDVANNNDIYWWGDDKTPQVYTSVSGSVTISDDKKSVTFDDLTSDQASVDLADNKTVPVSGYFVDTDVVDAANLPIWFYIDTDGLYWQYPNTQADTYVDATSEVTANIDVVTGKVVSTVETVVETTVPQTGLDANNMPPMPPAR